MRTTICAHKSTKVAMWIVCKVWTNGKGERRREGGGGAKGQELGSAAVGGEREGNRRAVSTGLVEDK